jgi:cell wall assembly regulator SMI1
MKTLWDRFHVWLNKNAPQVLPMLNRPATDAQVRGAEEAMSVKLPDDVKAAYRIHNGGDGFLWGLDWHLPS